MSQCAIVAAEPAAGLYVGVPLGRACGDLLELFSAVSDGRCGQGRDHPVAAVLALAAAATVAGMSGYRAIAGWVADVPAGVLADLYRRAGATAARPPGRTTIWRVLSGADADALDNATGAWLSTLLASDTDTGDSNTHSGGRALTHLRLDGKTLRGTKDSDGNQQHLLAVMAGPPNKAAVTAQAQVDGAKPRESITARDMLAPLDLTDTVLTADALHTVKATAELIRARGGHFGLPVKENREALFDALDALPWQTVPIAHSSTDKGHGRITTRTIQTMPAPPGLPFPHLAQVWLIERYVTDHASRAISAVAQLGGASLDPSQASPADLAAFNRHQWGIEVQHWIRDTCYRDDHSRVRTRNGPRIMASLRNLAIGALRLSGRTDITEATRWACRNINRPFTILKLTT